MVNACIGFFSCGVAIGILLCKISGYTLKEAQKELDQSKRLVELAKYNHELAKDLQEATQEMLDDVLKMRTKGINTIVGREML